MLVVVAVLTVLAVWPQGLSAARVILVAQLVSFRWLVAAVLVLGVLAALLVAILGRRRRRVRTVALLAATVLAAGVALDSAVISSRDAEPAAVAPGPADLTVLSWNTEIGGPGPGRVATAVLTARADVVVLPETDEVFADRVVELLAAEGRSFAAHVAVSPSFWEPTPTALLVDARLGEYWQDETAGTTPALPSGAFVPVDGTGPTLVAAHPTPPMPWSMGAWADGLRWVADRCPPGADAIVAGDLNATVDHWSGLGTEAGRLGDCRDAAFDRGEGATGTWPTAVPSAVGAPIDHVLVSSDWQVIQFEVLEGEATQGSDHRPVVARLRDAR